jgi:fumarate hydratase subunit alpha
MRKIHVKKIKDTVAGLCIKANIVLRDDIRRALKRAVAREKAAGTRRILHVLLRNARLAEKEERALCQDTGLVTVYLRVGQDVTLTGGDLKAAVNKGVEEGYARGMLRKSVVKSPLRRVNTGTNTPALIHTSIERGRRITVTVVPKGFGSENKSSLAMLNPTEGEKEIIDFILRVVKEAGPDACPPYVLGIGLGGSFDEAAALAKRALIVPVDRPNPKAHLGKLERAVMKRVNALGIGPMGLGGRTTCLGVNILEHATHIAGLPVAVNVGCHITRSASRTI